MATSRQIKIGLFLTSMIVIITGIFYAYQLYSTPNIAVNEEEKRFLYIPTGANFQNVLDSLEHHDLLQDKTSFAFLSKLMKYQEAVKPGLMLSRPK